MLSLRRSGSVSEVLIVISHPVMHLTPEIGYQMVAQRRIRDTE